MVLAGFGFALSGAASKTDGAVIPTGADFTPYHELGMSMQGRAWVKRVQGSNFDYVSAIELGNGWYITAAHSVMGSWGTATLTVVGRGNNPVTEPGETFAVTEQHVYEGYSYSNGNTTIDACMFYAPTSTGNYNAVFGTKPNPSDGILAVGNGMLAYQSGYDNPVYVVPYNQDVAAWHNVCTNSLPSNTSSTYFLVEVIPLHSQIHLEVYPLI